GIRDRNVTGVQTCALPISQRLGIGIGTASIAMGSLLVAVVAALGVFPGIGTIFNVLVVGICLNLLLATPVLASLGTTGVAERLADRKSVVEGRGGGRGG